MYISNCDFITLPNNHVPVVKFGLPGECDQMGGHIKDGRTTW